MEKRHTLTLNGVRSHKLTEYVEKLCESEKVKIKTCYEDSYSFLHCDKESNWFTQQVRDGDSIVIESNDYNRLKFVEHLYLKRVAVSQQLKKVESEISADNHIRNNLYSPSEKSKITCYNGIKHSIDNIYVAKFDDGIKYSMDDLWIWNSN